MQQGEVPTCSSVYHCPGPMAQESGGSPANQIMKREQQVQRLSQSLNPSGWSKSRHRTRTTAVYLPANTETSAAADFALLGNGDNTTSNIIFVWSSCYKLGCCRARRTASRFRVLTVTAESFESSPHERYSIYFLHPAKC